MGIAGGFVNFDRRVLHRWQSIDLCLHAGWPLCDSERGASALAGDYNHNGIVDAADYVVWRETLGSTTNLAADGNNDHVINQADYDIWKTNFGNTGGSGGGLGSSSNTAVPEPASCSLLLLAMLVGAVYSRCRWL